MRKPGIWGLGFRIIRIADVIDDAGTTTGIVVHVAGNNTLFNQIVHIAPHGDNGQPDMAGNVITGMSLLGGVTEVAFNEGRVWLCSPLGMAEELPAPVEEIWSRAESSLVWVNFPLWMALRRWQKVFRAS